MVIKKWGNKLIDIDYISKKFGPVEMDVTNIEREPLHETSEYLRKLKDKKQVVNDCNNGEERIE